MPDLATDIGEAIAQTIRGKAALFAFLGTTGTDLHVEYTDLAPREWLPGATGRIVIVLAESEVTARDAASHRVAYLYEIRFDAVDVRNRGAHRAAFYDAVHSALAGGREWIANMPTTLGGSGLLTLTESISEAGADTDRPTEVISARVEVWRAA